MRALAEKPDRAAYGLPDGPSSPVWGIDAHLLFRVSVDADTLEDMGQPQTSPTAVADPLFELGWPSGLAHEPFFAALANLEGLEGSAEWHATVAGLIVLRLVDQRVDSRTVARGTSRSDTLPNLPNYLLQLLPSAAAAVEEVDQRDPLAAPLRELVQAAAGRVGRALTRTLLSYARALDAGAHWPLAADAYRTLLRFDTAPRAVASFSPPGLAPFVCDRLGHALRMMGDLEGASAAYAAGRVAARELGDSDAEFRIRISEALVTKHLGNLPAAAAALDVVIQDISTARQGGSDAPEIGERPLLAALGVQQDDVLALARHDRGAIAAHQRDFALAVQHYFAAWRAYNASSRRERVWLDMAHTLAGLGLRSAARDAYVALFNATRDQDLRLIALTNLLELAVLADRAGEFRSYRRLLTEASDSGTLSAELAAWVALFEGHGESKFGQRGAARVAFRRALALATRQRLNEVIIKADEALAALASGQVPLSHAAPDLVSPSLALGRIARTVRRVRRRVSAQRRRSL